ncbi:hypothetical protein SeLEV6574_g01514 [Synchytrium endobioticum]|uniref:EH domain-containing protein n=1 Tax=Synchytrium endobioticum TaxID=286115 RepID=A0A507DDG0_9FUNG|nr:hypothetical protein SeLEV6574_g01514 [Synchytrium endobioticum]
MNASAEFDWYISPADRFQAESDFQRYVVDGRVPLSSMEPIFTQSRLSQSDFLQAWNFVDLQQTQSVNQEQFVAFCHVLAMRRNGRTYPASLPSSLREKFLADESCKGLGTNAAKDSEPDPMIVQLESAISSADSQLKSLQVERNDASDKLEQLRLTHEELERLVASKIRVLKSLKDELEKLRSHSSGESQDVQRLMERLRTDKQKLEDRKNEILRSVAGASV